MINVPIKGVGIKVVEEFYSNGQPFYGLVGPDGGGIAILSVLDIQNKATQAQYIAEALAQAVDIGFRQGQAHVREALGLPK